MLTKLDTDFFNGLIDMWEVFSAERSLSQNDTTAGSSNNRFVVLNQSGLVLDQYAVVGLGDRVFDPNNNSGQFQDLPALDTEDPDPDRPYAILLNSGRQGTLIDATVVGTVPCLVDFGHVGHRFAVPVAGEYGLLASQLDASSAEILSPRTAAETALRSAILAADTEMEVVSVRGFPRPIIGGDFRISIEAEEIDVTSISVANKRIWGVTRGVNSTVAADHAEGETVTFVSGVLWSILKLTGTGGTAVASEENLALILSSIEVFSGL